MLLTPHPHNRHRFGSRLQAPLPFREGLGEGHDSPDFPSPYPLPVGERGIGGAAVLMRIATLLIMLAPLVSGCADHRGFSFIAAADMRGFTPPKHPGLAYFLGACEAMRDVGPGDFMICPGDFDPPGRVRATLDQVLGADYVWYPAVGNHEMDNPADMPWLRNYNAGGDTLPGVVRVGPPGAVETCYSFDHKNAHFVVINQ